ncbi:something about silencing protein 10-like isoform X1 [Durio zibethinus]|uniref:Something about silencing protein 10-like isoform X1 n=2 Tax=Durio zibethinus TaxID=66656 RepID=A0A6P5YRH1_DURZI|nr:something about silencing protein 10-like isoform X1 [Durio zibethinus]
MGKRGKSFKKDKRNPKRRHRDDDAVEAENVDDEIDVFHKQRDVVPLDMNGDVGDSDEDYEHPVFDLQDIDDDEEEDEEGDDDDIDDAQVSKFAAKIARQHKLLRAKFGGVEDEMHGEEDDDEDEKEEMAPWGGIKSRYYGGDNRDFELHSSDDEAPMEEEDEVKEILKERAKNLSIEDFGFEDASEDETNRELTLEKISAKGKGGKLSLDSEEAVDDLATFEKVKKDLNALSKEEQMDVVHSSAPELIGLLSELNAALEELESKVNPVLRKAKEGKIFLEGGMRYLEVKQILLLAYCQAITFYLLLKSEGQPVRDHPVLGRIVEIQGLLDKVKQLDGNLPSEWEEILKNKGFEMGQNLVKENAELVSDSGTKGHGPSLVRDVQVAEPEGTPNLLKLDSASNQNNKGVKLKRENDQVGVQSREMLKVRAALEEKLKQKGIFSSNIQKPDKTKKHVKLVNRQLETYDDFADDVIDAEGGARGLSNGHAISQHSNKITQLITAKQNKSKVVSGDDDLPKRDDIGERRRKHELRVLAGAAVKSEDDHGGEYDTFEDDGGISVKEENGDTEDTEDTEDSEDEFYKQVKQQRAAKLAAKAEIYTRTSAPPTLPETVDGKRQITHQIEKNRGLTRQRNKNTKNPRKKYRLQSKKREKQRKGQVRDIRKPAGQYGGETSGINIGISRSIRFKS